jgi:hypothetical protein
VSLFTNLINIITLRINAEAYDPVVRKQAETSIHNLIVFESMWRVETEDGKCGSVWDL